MFRPLGSGDLEQARWCRAQQHVLPLNTIHLQPAWGHFKYAFYLMQLLEQICNPVLAVFCTDTRHHCAEIACEKWAAQCGPMSIYFMYSVNELRRPEDAF